MKPRLDMDKIAKGLGAERQGRVKAAGGYFGAMQLAAEVQARFRTPSGGGRATDPAWTEKRLVPLTATTLKKLETVAATMREEANVNIEPLQLAALLLERAADQVTDEDAEEIVRKASSVGAPARVMAKASGR